MPTSDTKKTRSSKWWPFLPAPFILAGIGLLASVAWTAVLWGQVQDWEAASARIVRSELEYDNSGESAKYRLAAAYQYEFDGRAYDGTRVGVRDVWAGNNKQLKQQTRFLNRAASSKEPVDCYVNPNSPANSVLFRELPVFWVLNRAILGIVFAGVGGAASYLLRHAQRSHAEENDLRAEFPDEPWKWKRDWRDGVVTSAEKAGKWVAFAMATIWNLISWPVLTLLPRELEKENYPALLMLLFPVIGVGLIVWAVIAWRRHRRYGVSKFELATVPGVVGGSLAGVIHTNLHLDPADGFHQTLSCIRRTTTRSKGNSSTSQDVLWQDQRVMDRELAPQDRTRSVVPVNFRIPSTAAETKFDDNVVTTWRLTVKAAVPGIDYNASFDVPVFKTAESQDSVDSTEPHVADAYVRQESLEQLCEKQRIGLIPTTKGLELSFPPLRHLLLTLGVSVFAALWGGTIAFLFYIDFWWFGVLFAMFGLFIAYLLLDMLFWRSRVSVTARRLSFRSGISFLAKSREIAATDIRSISFKKGMQSNETLYYDLHVKTKAGDRYCIGKRVLHRSTIDGLKQRLEAELGIVEDTAC